MEESMLRNMYEKDWVDTWNLNDPEKIKQFYTEDVVLYQAPLRKALHGREHLLERYEDFLEMSNDVKVTLRDIHIDGDSVILEINIKGTNTGKFLDYEPTGKKIDLDTCLSFKVNDEGKITKHTTYLDTATLLRILGHIEVTGTRAEAA